MDYDFSGLCDGQLIRIEKRLESLKKAFISEYKVALGIINNQKANENRNEIMYDVETLFNNALDVTRSTFTVTMNKVITVLKRDL